MNFYLICFQREKQKYKKIKSEIEKNRNLSFIFTFNDFARENVNYKKIFFGDSHEHSAEILNGN